MEELLSETNTGTQMGERNQKVMPLTGRKRFSDITDITSNVRPERSVADEQGNPNDGPTKSAKDYIAMLLKENNTLLRLLDERNKIIEMSGMELQKLKISLQKANQQNWQLAQANSLMLAELNLGKDRLKAMQHELGCMTSILRAKNIELQNEKKANKQQKKLNKEKACTEEIISKPDDIEVDASLPADCKNPTTNRKRTLRSRSLGPTAETHQETAKEKDEGIRKSLRSACNVKATEPCEPNENLFEIEDTKLPMNPAPSVSPRYQTQGLRRSSLGRPMRKAAGKVDSYKEVPINVKMRRDE